MSDSLITRRDFETSELAKAFPPRFRHANKKLVFGLACPPGSRHEGKLGFSRWREMSLPGALDGHEALLESREDVFAYEVEPANTVAWYMNFADSNLFGFYGGGLLAQDEHQVLEHPALGSLREALPKVGEKPATVEGDRPTPVLVTGVERRCALATANLYGNKFARADQDTIRRATRVLSPPTVTNVLAMEAPKHGHGIYRRSEIELVLLTAFTGFSAARIESARLGSSPLVVIHTGFWGCGAFGGNRVLMAILQLLAARLAHIDRVVFHTFDRAGTKSLDEARAVLKRLAVAGASVSNVVGAIDALELAWGMSDGN